MLLKISTIDLNENDYHEQLKCKLQKNFESFIKLLKEWFLSY